jgi:hypothetical protein
MSSIIDLAFDQELIDGGCFPPGYMTRSNTDPPPPNNLDEIHEKLRQPRPSITTSNEDFLHFKSLSFSVTNKAEMISKILPIIRGRESIPSGQDCRFDNLKKLADISKPKPDYFNGSSPVEVPPKIRGDLGEYIVPSSNNRRPLLPNFFFELNAPNGQGLVVRRKVTRDLAYGARGMHRIQSYKQDQPMFDGNAYTIGGTYNSDCETLILYTTHPTRPTDPNGEPEYWTTKIRSYNMTDKADTFWEGVAAFRNAQDWAKEQRDAFIKVAKERNNER